MDHGQGPGPALRDRLDDLILEPAHTQAVHGGKKREITKQPQIVFLHVFTSEGTMIFSEFQ